MDGKGRRHLLAAALCVSNYTRSRNPAFTATMLRGESRLAPVSGTPAE